MEKIFTETELVHYLSTMPVHTPERQLDLWRTRKELHTLTTHLHFLGKPSIIPEKRQDLWHAQDDLHTGTTHNLYAPCISALQARKLYTLGLHFKALVGIKRNCVIPEEFEEALRLRGVNSKTLRKKLSLLVYPS